MTRPGRTAIVAILLGLLLSPALPPGCGEPADPSLALAAAPFFPDAEGEAAFLSRVYPNAVRDHEFIELANPGSLDVDLSGWSLSDGEDVAVFPEGTRLAAGGRLVAARNATGYAEDERRAADVTYGLGDAPRMGGGTLALADTGDEVLLADASGKVRDAYVYGASTYAGPGWTGRPARAPGRGEIATRASTGNGLRDRDEAGDWEGLRAYRLGQSDFHPPPREIAFAPRVLLSPDDGRGPLLSFLASADRSLEVAVYTLTSEAIGYVLAHRARSGVRVRVLLEGGPVGGVEEGERRVVDALLDAGAEVRFLCSRIDAIKRYRYLHAKYAIADGDAILVSSENFGDSGFPVPGGPGNRGWSVVVEDASLAGQLWEVFEEDFDPSRADSCPAVRSARASSLAPVAVVPWTRAALAGRCSARLVVGPDVALDPDGWLAAFEAAREHIWIEVFYADDPWGDAPNPLLEAAFAAARRGVQVRLLLDGSNWSSEAEVHGNGELAALLNARAAREGVDLEARVLSPAGSIERVHNKGLVADGAVALVSSLNWAHGSATENREIGLLLEDPEVAGRLESAFLADWEGRLPGGHDDPTIDDPLVVAAIYGFVAAASALSLRKMRRTNKGLKPRVGMVRRGLRRTDLRGRSGEVRVLPPELVVEPGDGARGGGGDRGGGEAALDGLRGPQGDRGP